MVECRYPGTDPRYPENAVYAFNYRLIAVLTASDEHDPSSILVDEDDSERYYYSVLLRTAAAIWIGLDRYRRWKGRRNGGDVAVDRRSTVLLTILPKWHWTVHIEYHGCRPVQTTAVAG